MVTLKEDVDHLLAIQTMVNTVVEPITITLIPLKTSTSKISSSTPTKMQVATKTVENGTETSVIVTQ